MSIKLDHVTYVYSGGTAFERKALDDICLEIPDGQFVGMIGHTGSGKSTLIQHLNGLLQATSGTIYVDGEDIYREGYDRKALRGRVGLVFQYPEHQLFETDVFTERMLRTQNRGFPMKNKRAGCLGPGYGGHWMNPFTKNPPLNFRGDRKGGPPLREF